MVYWPVERDFSLENFILTLYFVVMDMIPWQDWDSESTLVGHPTDGECRMI